MRLKSILLGAAAVASASLSLISAAAAQDRPGFDRGYDHDRGFGGYAQRADFGRGAGLEQRLQRTGQWIRSLSDRGALDPGEARRAWGMFRDARQQADVLRAHGFNGWEARRLDARLDRLDQFLRSVNRDGRRNW